MAKKGMSIKEIDAKEQWYGPPLTKGRVVCIIVGDEIGVLLFTYILYGPDRPWFILSWMILAAWYIEAKLLPRKIGNDYQRRIETFNTFKESHNTVLTKEKEFIQKKRDVQHNMVVMCSISCFANAVCLMTPGYDTYLSVYANTIHGAIVSTIYMIALAIIINSFYKRFYDDDVMYQGNVDDPNIHDLTDLANKDMLRQIDDVIIYKLKKLHNLTTCVAMCSMIVILGYLIH